MSSDWRSSGRLTFLVASMVAGLNSCDRTLCYNKAPSTVDTENSQAASNSSLGRLSVDPDRVSLHAEAGQAATAIDLSLTNIGTGTLQINSTSASCGCTIVELPTQTRLVPGEQTAIQVSVKFPPSGSRSSQLTIESSGVPASITVPIILHGPPLNPPWFASVPERVIVTGYTAGTRMEETLVLRTVEADEQNWIVKASSSDSSVSIEEFVVRETERLSMDSISKEYRCRLGVDLPDSAGAPNKSVLTFATDPERGRQEIKQIPVVASLIPAVRVVPEAVVLRVDDSISFPIEQSVLLLPSIDGPWSIEFVKPIPDWLSVAELAEEELPGNARRLQIQVRADELNLFDSGRSDSVVHIHCNHPDVDSLRIPVTIIRR